MKRNPPGKILVVVNNKGGVGKSTIAFHLASGLHEQGVPVRLVDADAQGSSSGWMTGADSGVESVRMQTPDAIIERVRPWTLDGTTVIADGPAGETEINRALLLVADLAVLPCGPSALDLETLTETVRVLDQAKSIRGGLPQGVLVPNRLQARTKLSHELETTLSAFGLPVLPGLSYRQAYPEAAGQKTAVWRLPGEGAQRAGAEMQALVAAVVALLR